MATSLRRLRRTRVQTTMRGVDHAHGVFDRDELIAARLGVALGATKTRQDERLFAVDEVRAIELRRDVHREITVPHRRFGELRVGGRRDEVPAQSEEDANLAVAHRAQGIHGVKAVLTRGVETELVAQLVEERVRHLLPDPHRAIALDVAVTTNG